MERVLSSWGYTETYAVDARLRPFFSKIEILKLNPAPKSGYKDREIFLWPEEFIKFSLGGKNRYRGPNGFEIDEEAASFGGSDPRYLQRSLPNEGGIFVVADVGPVGISAAFGISATETRENNIPLKEMIGPVADILQDRLQNARSNKERFQILHGFLLSLLPRLKAPPALLNAALERVLETKGTIPIQELADFCGVGTQQLFRTFKRWTGFSPKEIASITRMRYVVEFAKKTAEINWTDTAHAFGFHDQAHMIHTFNGLVGISPSTLHQKLRLPHVLTSVPEGVS